MSARQQRPNWASLSVVGRVRTHNEDSVLVEPPLFAVADGLGGHEAGEVASAIAVQTLRDNAPRHADSKGLARAVRAANREVIRAAKEGVGRSGMGTTITAALVEGPTIAIAQVGDSRAYLMHNGFLERLTEDHSMVADLVRSGQITEAESRVHPHRSVITRALGTDTNMYADAYEIDAEPGDRLLLCSDGLTGMVEDARIGEILGSYSDPEMAATSLVDAANEAGGHDNISVVIVDIEDSARAGSRSTGGTGTGRGWISVVVWLLVAALVIGGIGYGVYAYARSKAYLIEENGVVVIYRGVPGEVAGVALKWPVESTLLDAAAVERLPLNVQKRLAEGLVVDGGVDEARAAARNYLELSAPTGSFEPSSTP